MRRRRTGWAACSALLVILAGVWVEPASAQRLEEVDSLARSGEMESARALLLDWFDQRGDEASRSEVQRAIWLRGILTVDPSQAAVDFTRLALEYSGGPFSDQALLRLARAARARGEVATAARHYRRLARDYPGSPGRIEARSWLDERAAAIAAAELQLSTGRAAAPATSEPDSAPRAAAAVPAVVEDTPEETADSEGAFAVQFGAFGSPERARGLLRRLAEADVDARLVTVPGSDLIRVRAGRFVDGADAIELRGRARAAGFEAIVVDDARREVRFR